MASKTTVASSLMITWATLLRICPGRRLAEGVRVIAAAVPSTADLCRRPLAVQVVLESSGLRGSRFAPITPSSRRLAVSFARSVFAAVAFRDQLQRYARRSPAFRLPLSGSAI